MRAQKKPRKEAEARPAALGGYALLSRRVSRTALRRQQQRAIARSLGMHPDVMLFDEPTSALTRR